MVGRRGRSLIVITLVMEVMTARHLLSLKSSIGVRFGYCSPKSKRVDRRPDKAPTHDRRRRGEVRRATVFTQSVRNRHAGR